MKDTSLFDRIVANADNIWIGSCIVLILACIPGFIWISSKTYFAILLLISMFMFMVWLCLRSVQENNDGED